MPVTQHITLTSEVDERDASIAHRVTSATSAVKPTKMLDEVEAEERHGGQYHLRHHLSGCAQTLYTVDFNELLTPTVSSAESNTALLLNNSAQDSASMSIITPSVETSLSLTPVETTQSLDPALFTSEVSENAPVSTLNEPLPDDTSLMHATATPAQFNAIPENSPLTAITENLENTPQSVTANNLDQFAGWQVNSALSAQINEGGQLLLDDKLVENSTLLTQQLQMSADSHYQFDMKMMMNDNSEPPSFALNIDGQEIPLIAVRVAEGYLLHGEFTATETESTSISLIAKGKIAAGHHLLLDHPTVDVMPLPAVEVHLAVEPVFDFAAITVVETDTGDKQADISVPAKNVLVEVHADLMISPVVEHSETAADITLESLAGSYKAEDWNAIETHASITEIAIPSEFELQINPLEEHL